MIVGCAIDGGATAVGNSGSCVKAGMCHGSKAVKVVAFKSK